MYIVSRMAIHIPEIELENAGGPRSPIDKTTTWPRCPITLQEVQGCLLTALKGCEHAKLRPRNDQVACEQLRFYPDVLSNILRLGFADEEVIDLYLFMEIASTLVAATFDKRWSTCSRSSRMSTASPPSHPSTSPNSWRQAAPDPIHKRPEA
jgi:hypothetical protein